MPDNAFPGAIRRRFLSAISANADFSSSNVALAKR